MSHASLWLAKAYVAPASLYASQVVHNVSRCADDLDVHNVENALHHALARAQIAQNIGIIARENLKISWHREKLRYATIRREGSLPSIRRLAMGRVPAKRGPFHPGIHRVKKVNPNGAVLLQGKCGSKLIKIVCHRAPSHLPDTNPTLNPSLARSDRSLACEVCAVMDEVEKMLSCHGCGTGWHTMCLQPPLATILKEDWLCPRGYSLVQNEELAFKGGTKVQHEVPPCGHLPGQRLNASCMQQQTLTPVADQQQPMPVASGAGLRCRRDARRCQEEDLVQKCRAWVYRTPCSPPNLDWSS
eukprot:1153136-Pelagomonas_calceolata.AAC.2